MLARPLIIATLMVLLGSSVFAVPTAHRGSYGLLDLSAVLGEKTK